MVKDEDVFPIGTVVRLKSTGEFCKITGHNWLRPELKKHFLNYFCEIEGKKGRYAVYHNEVELEALP